MAGNVLIACNSYAGKSYCAEAWVEHGRATLAAYEEQHPGARTDILVVDNTRGSDGYAELMARLGCRVIKITPKLTFEQTMHLGMQIIHQELWIEDWDWVFHVEADNIIPAHTLNSLMRIAEAGDFHIVTHTYPFHLLEQWTKGRNRTNNPRRFFYNEMGICLMSRRILGHGLADYSRYDNVTNAIFHSVNKYSCGWGTATNLISVEENIHLDGYHQEYSQFLTQNTGDGRWNPYENYDLSEYGTELPECIRADYEKQGIGMALKMEEGTYTAAATGKRIRPRKRRYPIPSAQATPVGQVKSGNGKARARGTRPKVEAVGTKI